MTILLGITVFLLTGVSLTLLGFWSVVAYYAAGIGLRLPTVRDALRFPEAVRAREPGADAPPVCVLIPAHNEADVIGELARSLVAQDYPNMSVVFVLDRCTDATRRLIESAVGADARFEIMEIGSCPPDWAGKVNALWRAVNESPAAGRAELLLFADADTYMHPACVRATVALLRRRDVDMLSLLSTLTADRWFEVLVQPATAFELIRQYPLHRVDRGAHRRPFANGQFILIRRDAYERIGGHQAVQGEVFEDVRLAQHASRRGLRLGVFLADRMMYCRMYKDWTEFQRGWNRIYSESCNRRPSRLRLCSRRVWLVGTFLPVGAAACVGGGLLMAGLTTDPLGIVAVGAGVVSLAWFFGTLLAAYRIGGMPLWSVPLYPIGAWLTGLILRRAARDLEQRRPVVWGAKEYPREAR